MHFILFLVEGCIPAFMHLRKAIQLATNPDSSILEVRNEFDSFYSKLWTAYRERFPALARAMGYDIVLHIC